MSRTANEKSEESNMSKPTNGRNYIYLSKVTKY
jgi:hypothetical protein